MAKTETVNLEATPRAWLPPMDGGTALMALLIGLMGFYVLYPLLLIILNSFNTATIAEPPVYGFKAWREAFSEAGIWRPLLNSVKIGIVLQVSPCRWVFCLVAARSDQYLIFQCL
jgi:ABC-type spermidine/putrescine transport system permease subunit II